MLKSREKEKFCIRNAECFSLFMNTAFSKNQDLLALGQRLHNGGPFLKSNAIGFKHED